jgi:hypothetical protein
MGIERTDIGNAIIAGIAEGGGVLNQMSEIVTHLELAGFVIIPKEAIDWLNGEIGTFERPEGKRGNFWWRSEFRRRAGLQ